MSDTLRHNQKAKTTGSFPAHGLYSEAGDVFFDFEDFLLSRSAGTATCGARRLPGAQIPLWLSASGTNTDKSFAANPRFFATPLFPGIASLTSCARAHKIFG